MNRTAGEGPPRETLPAALERAADGDPSRGVTIVGRGGTREWRGWDRIWAQARRTAAALRLEGLEPMDRVLLAFPSGFDFLGAFFGTIAVGALPIPCPLPSRWRPVEDANDSPLATFGRRLQADALLVDSDIVSSARPSALPTRPWSLVTDLPTLLEDVPVGVSIDDDLDLPETAYIQLTEGATAPPRGVLLTHANIVANLEAIGRALDVRDDDVGVSWIPLHNPLGLLGVVCFGVYFDLEIVLLDPERFLKHPESWLHAISRHGGTLSPAPNFAYDYAVRRCRESDLEGLDLSSWRVAMSGGEPVRAQHLEAFARRFREYGLRDDVFTPVYGLSETTLAATFGPLEASCHVDAVNRRRLETEGVAEPLPDSGAPSPDQRMHLVSVGEPLDNLEMTILNEEGEELGERKVGDIALRGPNVMRGYVDADSSDGASEASTRIEEGWLRTGDIGYRADGRLYIVGRACDRIELENGRTLFPEEIELFVDAVDGVYAGRTAAFGVPSGDGATEASSHSTDEPDGTDEALVVAFELQSGAGSDSVEASVRALLERHLALEPDALVALPPRSIPRTKSGKIRRSMTRALYRRNLLDRRRRSGRFPALRRIWQDVRRRVERTREAIGRPLERWIEWFD